MNTPMKTCIILSFATLSATLLVDSAQAQSRKSLPPTGVVLPAFPQQRVIPGRDRFLDEPVLTTDALVESLKTNKIFRRNIAKHFGLAEERVVEFVQDALVPYILPSDMPVQNYGVTKGGLIYSKKMSLKKGTRVWATRDGSPILKWICSNPLLPKAPVLPKKPTPTTVSRSVQPSGLMQVASNIQEPGGLSAIDGGELGFETPSTPIKIARIPDPVKPTNTIVEPKPNPAPAVPVIAQLARTGLPLLPLAGVAGAIVRSQPTPAPGLSQPSSVPEPATFALAALGLVGLPLLRRKK
jgi:PEP-CTERM motif